MTQDQPKSLYSLRKEPMQGRSKATVEAVLEASARLLVSIGYDNASTNKIAELAGVGIGSLYEYFPGKEAIFAELRRREDQRHLDFIFAEPEPVTYREVLRIQVTTYIKLVLSNIDLHVALLREVPAIATREADTKRNYDLLGQMNKDIISHRVQLRPQCEPDIVIDLCSRVLRSTINDYAIHSPKRLKQTEIAEQIVDMLERYALP